MVLVLGVLVWGDMNGIENLVIGNICGNGEHVEVVQAWKKAECFPKKRRAF